MAASLEQAGDEPLTFYRFPASQQKSLRTTNPIERLQEKFRRRVKTEASLPSEKGTLRVFFGLFASGQVKMRRIEGWFDPASAPAEGAWKKPMASQEKMSCLLFPRNRDTTSPHKVGRSTPATAMRVRAVWRKS